MNTKDITSNSSDDEGIDVETLWAELRASGYKGNIWPPSTNGSLSAEDLAAAIEACEVRPKRHTSVEKADELTTFTQAFAACVAESLSSSREERLSRLAMAAKIPERRTVSASVFERNPDVVAEVLFRAKGNCERCLHPAPFLRRSDGSPYLEVHHLLALADGGEDTVDNATALCPNCHRYHHNA